LVQVASDQSLRREYVELHLLGSVPAQRVREVRQRVHIDRVDVLARAAAYHLEQRAGVEACGENESLC
jgi:hypothetical protein